MKTAGRGAADHPWPDDHVGHWWSGWPEAYCLRCGASDPWEEALADGWVDVGPHLGPGNEVWDTEEHRLLVEERMRCSADERKPTGDSGTAGLSVLE